MRKTSQDGGDSTSITSGIENERKTGGIMKSKRNSIKRKVQNLSHESDDAVIEPLLQKDKEKTDLLNQSAKYDLLLKTKTDATNEKRNDKEKLLHEGKSQKLQLSDARNVTDTITSNTSSNLLSRSTGATVPLHNHMNTNVFSSHDALKDLISSKSQILVEIDASKQTGYSPSPLIFTTAKIHTDGKTKHMEPLQVTAVPILSTIEVSVKGSGINNSGETSGIITSNISSIYTKSNSNILDKNGKFTTSISATLTTMPSNIIDTKSLVSSNKQLTSNILPTKEEKISDAASLLTKISANNLKDSKMTENYSINNESQKDKDVKQTKMSLSQTPIGTNSTTTKSSTDTSKSAYMQININTSMNKVSIPQTDVPKGIEHKTDLNKNISTTDSRDTKHSPLDSKPEKTCKDKGSINTVSDVTKQLQRQKTIDKDDSISKLKSKIDSSSLINESKSRESGTSSTTHIKSSIIPKLTANDIHTTTINTKLPNVASTATVNKITTSVNPVIKHNETVHSMSKPKVSDAPILLATKSLSNNVSATSSIISSKPLPSTQTDTKGVDNTKVETSSSTTQLISDAKLTAMPSITKVAKPTPQATSGKITESTIKGSVPPINTIKTVTASTGTVKNVTVSNTTKSIPITTSAVKGSSSLIDSIKSVPTSTSGIKNSSMLTDSVKNAPVSTTIAKNAPVLTSAVKNSSMSSDPMKSTAMSTRSVKSIPASISTANNSSLSMNAVKSIPTSTNTAKNVPVPISTENSSNVAMSSKKGAPSSTSAAKHVPFSISAVKNSPVSTSAAKNTSVTTSAASSSIAKSNITPTSKISVTSSAVPSATVTTTTSGVPTVSTTTVSTKNGDAKSAELSNGSKNVKA